MKANPKLTAEYRRLARYSYKTTVRAATDRFQVSRGKVDDARKVYPPSAFSLKLKTGRGSIRSMVVPNKTRNSIPARWCRAAEAGRRLVANQQQEAILKVIYGYELIRAKAHVDFGDWLDELKRYCPYGCGSAGKFMRVAEHLIPPRYLKFTGPANLGQRPLPRKVLSQIRATIAGRAFEKLHDDLFKSKTPKPKIDAEAAVPKEIAQEPCLTGKIPPASEKTTEVANIELLHPQAPVQVIAQLARRIMELPKKRPEMATEAAEMELKLQQARIVVIAAQELLARAGELDTVPPLPN